MSLPNPPAPFAHLADPLLRVEEGRTRLLDPVPPDERARLG